MTLPHTSRILVLSSLFAGASLSLVITATIASRPIVSSMPEVLTSNIDPASQRSFPKGGQQMNDAGGGDSLDLQTDQGAKGPEINNNVEIGNAPQNVAGKPGTTPLGAEPNPGKPTKPGSTHTGGKPKPGGGQVGANHGGGSPQGGLGGGGNGGTGTHGGNGGGTLGSMYNPCAAITRTNPLAMEHLVAIICVKGPKAPGGACLPKPPSCEADTKSPACIKASQDLMTGVCLDSQAQGGGAGQQGNGSGSGNPATGGNQPGQTGGPATPAKPKEGPKKKPGSKKQKQAAPN